LRREPDERARWEKLLDEMVPEFAKSPEGSFLYRDIQKHRL
jgi:hypothetical protein